MYPVAPPPGPGWCFNLAGPCRHQQWQWVLEQRGCDLAWVLVTPERRCRGLVFMGASFVAGGCRPPVRDGRGGCRLRRTRSNEPDIEAQIGVPVN